MSKSSNCSTSLLFSIEQWEFIRRLRNSGISKEQVLQAFDDLDRIEREIGSSIFTAAATTPSSSLNDISSNLLSLLQQQFTNASATDQTVFSKNINNFQLFMAKNIAALNLHQRLIAAAASTTTTSPGTTTTTTTTTASSAATAASSLTTPTTTTTNSSNRTYNDTHEVIEDEIKELEEFRSKGDIVNQQEISNLVHKRDLKQSQIARMAGVNQAYVSKFLRGDFSDLSENGKTLIYKWYLRYVKNPSMLTNGQYANSVDNSSVIEPASKIIKIECSSNNSATNGSASTMYSFMNGSYDAPKRTRFSFKPDHLVILEKSFAENPYPDPKKREELAKLCNNVRNTSDLSDRERVTEQIVTHWFQNKRKLNRRINCDEQLSSSQNDENSQQQQQLVTKQRHDSVDYDNDDSPVDYQDFLDEAQLAAYKAVMRMNNNKSPIISKTDQFNHHDEHTLNSTQVS